MQCKPKIHFILLQAVQIGLRVGSTCRPLSLIKVYQKYKYLELISENSKDPELGTWTYQGTQPGIQQLRLQIWGWPVNGPQ